MVEAAKVEAEAEAKVEALFGVVEGLQRLIDYVDSDCALTAALFHSQPTPLKRARVMADYGKCMGKRGFMGSSSAGTGGAETMSKSRPSLDELRAVASELKGAFDLWDEMPESERFLVHDQALVRLQARGGR